MVRRLAKKPGREKEEGKQCLCTRSSWILLQRSLNGIRNRSGLSWNFAGQKKRCLISRTPTTLSPEDFCLIWNGGTKREPRWSRQSNCSLYCSYLAWHKTGNRPETAVGERIAENTALGSYICLLWDWMGFLDQAAFRASPMQSSKCLLCTWQNHLLSNGSRNGSQWAV